MGSILYNGNKILFVEDDGTHWDSEEKKIQYDPKTLLPMTGTEISMSEGAALTIGKIIPEGELICQICGFEAKSNAGLAVHKMKHENKI